MELSNGINFITLMDDMRDELPMENESLKQLHNLLRMEKKSY